MLVKRYKSVTIALQGKIEKMSKTTLNLRVDAPLKKQAEKVFDDLGISMSSAVVLYLKAVVREQGIPFDIKLKREETKIPTTKKENKKEMLDQDFEILGSDSLFAAINKL